MRQNEQSLIEIVQSAKKIDRGDIAIFLICSIIKLPLIFIWNVKNKNGDEYNLLLVFGFEAGGVRNVFLNSLFLTIE